MVHDPWDALATHYVEAADSSVKGYVRLSVAHAQLMRHLPEPPAHVLDVGGGAAQPDAVRKRVRLLDGTGERADAVTGGQSFAAVLCHGVLMYVEDPGPLIAALCRSTQPGGMLSISALNSGTLAVRPAVEHRWSDALAAFDATREAGVLGTDTRADTVEGLSGLLNDHGVNAEGWYGTWLFTDWLDLDPGSTDVEALAAVELEASMRDPYRQLSRVFHLIGRAPLP